MTRDMLIFPLAITQILHHFSSLIPDSPYYTVMGAISAASVRRSEAQLQLKQPRMEMIDPLASTIPSTSASSLGGSVTLEAIMTQLQSMDALLDTPNDELCQVNTHVSRIAQQQACLSGFAASPSPSPKASADEDGDDGADDNGRDKNASSSNDKEMTTSQ